MFVKDDLVQVTCCSQSMYFSCFLVVDLVLIQQNQQFESINSCDVVRKDNKTLFGSSTLSE